MHEDNEIKEQEPVTGKKGRNDRLNSRKDSTNWDRD